MSLPRGLARLVARATAPAVRPPGSTTHFTKPTMPALAMPVQVVPSGTQPPPDRRPAITDHQPALAEPPAARPTIAATPAPPPAPLAASATRPRLIPVPDPPPAPIAPPALPEPSGSSVAPPAARHLEHVPPLVTQVPISPADPSSAAPELQPPDHGQPLEFPVAGELASPGPDRQAPPAPAPEGAPAQQRATDPFEARTALISAQAPSEPAPRAAEPVPPVQIGVIEVQVAAPPAQADPFAGCRALADGLTARRGGGW